MIGFNLYHKFMTGKVITRIEGCPVASVSILDPMPSEENISEKVIMNLRVNANLIGSGEDV